MHRLPAFAVLSALVLGALAGLAGCADDSTSPPSGGGGDDGPPDPYDGRDEITFRVYVEDAAGTEDLRWVGDPAGPDDDSPETTDAPFVPFGRAFRVEWDVDAFGAPVAATRYRVYRSGNEDFFLPFVAADSVAYDDTRSFRFANEIASSGVDPVNCGTGPNCYGDLRLPSGRTFFEVESINENGRVIDTLQTLTLEVNYPPRAMVPLLPPVPDAGAASPAWSVDLRDGGRLERALVEGDTIPSGASVRVLVRGEDRFDGVADSDSFCCDVRLDDEVPAIQFQGRALFTVQQEDGFRETLTPLFGDVDPDSVLVVDVGPADYELEFRVVDEHGRRSESKTVNFVVGLPPQRPRMQPDDGTAFVLLPPDQPAPEIDGAPAYVTVDRTLYFDRVAQEWSSFQNFDTDIPQTGALYRIPLRILSDPHPDAAEVTNALGGEFTDVARAFAYELQSEYDPRNQFDQGPGDRLDFFLATNSPGEIAFDDLGAGDFDGLEVFVPDNVWVTPGYYDSALVQPGDPPPIDFLLEIGARIRKELGAYTFRARARTTTTASKFTQFPPAPDGQRYENAAFEVGDFSRYGRVSPTAEQSFSIRLQIDVAGQPVQWPPPADAAVAVNPADD